MTEIGQIPFALCEIVAKAEEAGRSDIAHLADSIFDLLAGVSSLKVLELPLEAKEEIRAVVNRYLPHVAETEAV